MATPSRSSFLAGSSRPRRPRTSWAQADAYRELPSSLARDDARVDSRAEISRSIRFMTIIKTQFEEIETGSCEEGIKKRVEWPPIIGEKKSSRS